MIRDITLGQHIPGNTVVHTFDPRLKLGLVVLYIVVLFVAGNLAGLAFSAALLLGLYRLAKIPMKMLRKAIKPIVPVLIFTGVLNMFFVPGRPIFTLGFLQPTWEGVSFAVLMVVRIMCLISATSLLTYTTSPIVLTDALERVMKPLKALHLPVHEIAMMMTIALRFIPTLMEETEKIMNAQKARGANLDVGNLIEKVKALVPVLIPLFISAFRRAEELATAMECRCYHGGEGRTRLRVLKITSKDLWCMGVVLVAMAAIVSTRFWFTI